MAGYRSFPTAGIFEGQSRSDSEEIVGKWRLNAIRAKDKQQWVWEYGFEANGVVPCRDPLNNMNGAGKWSLTPKSIFISWAPKSTTKENWFRPISAGFQTGDYQASDGAYTVVAERTSQGSVEPPFVKPSGYTQGLGPLNSFQRFRALLWFLLWCAFFSLAFTRFYSIADSLLLVALSMGLLIVTGVKIQKLWKYRSDPQMREAHMGSGQGGVFENKRWLRWALDEEDPKVPTDPKR